MKQEPSDAGTGLEPDNLYMFYSCYIINYFHRLKPWGFIFSQLQLLVTSFNDINKFADLVFQLYLGNLKRLHGKYLVMILSGTVHRVLGGSYGY